MLLVIEGFDKHGDQLFKVWMKADKLIYAFSSSSKNWTRVPAGFGKTRAGSGFKKVLSGRVKFVGSGRVPGFSKTRASPTVKCGKWISHTHFQLWKSALWSHMCLTHWSSYYSSAPYIAHSLSLTLSQSPSLLSLRTCLLTAMDRSSSLPHTAPVVLVSPSLSKCQCWLDIAPSVLKLQKTNSRAQKYDFFTLHSSLFHYWKWACEIHFFTVLYFAISLFIIRCFTILFLKWSDS